MQISIDTIDKNYVRGFPKQRLLKLNVSNVKEDRIEKGIRIVMEEIKQAERLNFQFKKNKMERRFVVRRKIILLFVCIAIIIGAVVLINYYKKDDQCIAIGKYSRGIIVDQNNEPISNVKIYEDTIKRRKSVFQMHKVNLKY